MVVATGKVQGLPKVYGFILWAAWISAIHQTVAELFQPKVWTKVVDQQADMFITVHYKVRTDVTF